MPLPGSALALEPAADGRSRQFALFDTQRMLSGSGAAGLGRRARSLCASPQREETPLNDLLPCLRTAQPISRRSVIGRSVGWSALATAVMLGWKPPAQAQRRSKGEGPSEIPLDELLKPGPLPELVVGNADAPITVVEYASMTCGHCANFHTKVFEALKEKYVDTGKVRFILREFPLDNLAAAASMLARCSGEGKTLPMISVLFAKQEEWAFGRGDPKPELFKVAKQAGFTQESFEKCLTDQKLLDDIIAIRTTASDKYGVNATPTFFINGKKMSAAPTLEEFDKAFASALKS
jgi:protein-disulfide isomerase